MLRCLERRIWSTATAEGYGFTNWLTKGKPVAHLSTTNLLSKSLYVDPKKKINLNIKNFRIHQLKKHFNVNKNFKKENVLSEAKYNTRRLYTRLITEGKNVFRCPLTQLYMCHHQYRRDIKIWIYIYLGFYNKWICKMIKFNHPFI